MSIPLKAEAASLRRRSIYREFAVPASIGEVASCFWEGRAGWARSIRVLPDGCVDIVWNGRELLVAGARPVAVRHPLRADGGSTAVRLRPGVAGGVLGAGVHELPEAAVALDGLWGGAAKRAAERLAHGGDSSARFAILERLLFERLQSGYRPDRTVAESARHLAHASIDEVARRSGLSTRELRRRFLHQVGYGPKALQRVLRFRAFLQCIGDVAGGRSSLAGVAADLGYADQAHLCRECLQLSGTSPGALVRQWKSS
jgi:AraC-like DNA-binding protein